MKILGDRELLASGDNRGKFFAKEILWKEFTAQSRSEQLSDSEVPSKKLWYRRSIFNLKKFAKENTFFDKSFSLNDSNFEVKAKELFDVRRMLRLVN